MFQSAQSSKLKYRKFLITTALSFKLLALSYYNSAITKTSLKIFYRRTEHAHVVFAGNIFIESVAYAL